MTYERHDGGTPGGWESVAYGEIYRPHTSSWPRLVRGQRITQDGREWRVTEISTSPDGDETYRLDLAEVVDAEPHL